jgi:hypothetical protein
LPPTAWQLKGSALPLLVIGRVLASRRQAQVANSVVGLALVDVVNVSIARIVAMKHEPRQSMSL